MLRRWRRYARLVFPSIPKHRSPCRVHDLYLSKEGIKRCYDCVWTDAFGDPPVRLEDATYCNYSVWRRLVGRHEHYPHMQRMDQ